VSFAATPKMVGVAFLCTLDLMTTRRTRVFRRGFVAPGPVAAAEGVDATQLPRLQLGWHRLIPPDKISIIILLHGDVHKHSSFAPADPGRRGHDLDMFWR
jgi:hypothetical protein